MITYQRRLLRIQLIVIFSYFVIKFVIRPIVLENKYAGLVKIFVLSYPNFCEAVAGTIVLTFILLIINGRRGKEGFKLKEKHLYLIAVLIAGIYVLLQEFKIHNLGGINVYDPYDVIFSIVGLIVAFCLLIKIKPKYIER